jgi:hypothetical protein
MDKIEIIDIDDGEEEIEEEEEIDEDEEDEDEDGEDGFIAYKDSIKKKTDRELMESIALRLISLEHAVKKMQDDLVDTYNLIVESETEGDED